MFSRFVGLVAVLVTASAGLAHEGHGHPEHVDGVMHYVVNPSHSVSAVSVAVIAVAACAVLRKLIAGRSSKN